MRAHNRTINLRSFLPEIIVGLLFLSQYTSAAAGKHHAPIGPTVENALAADQELAKAIRENDTTGILRLLDKDWAVISGRGGVAEGPSIFPDGIRTNYLTRKTFEISEPRVRLYGDVALVTTKVRTSGLFQGKTFDVVERQTDVLHWVNGGWKCILTHETLIPGT
jgi:ketosteroid isomerase-like protein